MRTLMLIKQLLKDSDLSGVRLYLGEDDKILVETDPMDEDLVEKIQMILNKELSAFFNDIQ